MDLTFTLPLALLALSIEAAFGYPQALLRRVGHPVVWIGALIDFFDRRLNKERDSFELRRRKGTIALVILLTIVIFITAFITRFATSRHSIMPASRARRSRASPKIFPTESSRRSSGPLCSDCPAVRLTRR